MRLSFRPAFSYQFIILQSGFVTTDCKHTILEHLRIPPGTNVSEKASMTSDVEVMASVLFGGKARLVGQHKVKCVKKIVNFLLWRNHFHINFVILLFQRFVFPLE